MVAIAAKDVAAIYNHVWDHRGQTTTVAGLTLVATRPNAFRLVRQKGPFLDEIWRLEFVLKNDHWVGPTGAMREGEILFRDYHPNTHGGGWGAVDFKDYQRCGKFQIKKVSGDLTQFQKDWVMLLMFQHEFTEAAD